MRRGGTGIVGAKNDRGLHERQARLQRRSADAYDAAMNAAYDNPSSELDHAAKQALEQMLAGIKVLHGGAPLSTLA